METPDKEASIQGADDSETLETELSEESVNDETSTDGTQEDADPLKKVISDKDRHIVKLEKELRDARAGTTEKGSTGDDYVLWTAVHADELKLVDKEFLEELKFYKEHNIEVNDEIRNRALRDAKNRKGLGTKNTAGADRQAATSSPTQGESRSVHSDEIPENVAKLIKKATGKEPTKEDYNRWKQDIEARKKKKG